MWSERARSWRKKGKRGVSPIIATILLVAITVVLAAVLYILISGLTRGPGNTPIGSAFGLGTASMVQGTASTPGCAVNHYCYQVAIASASPGVTASSIQLQIQTQSGTVYAVVGGGSAGIYNISGNNVVKAAVGAAFSVTTWTPTAPFTTTTQLQTSMVLWVDLGTANPSNQGYTLIVEGAGSYSGQVSTQLP